MRHAGYTYQQERGFDVAEKMAANEGAGNFSSAGIGIGMMAGVGASVSNTVGVVFSDAINRIDNKATDSFCEECGSRIFPNSVFCEECGHPINSINKNKCPECGYIYERPGKFCPKCGHRREV